MVWTTPSQLARFFLYWLLGSFIHPANPFFPSSFLRAIFGSWSPRDFFVPASPPSHAPVIPQVPHFPKIPQQTYDIASASLIIPHHTPCPNTGNLRYVFFVPGTRLSSMLTDRCRSPNIGANTAVPMSKTLPLSAGNTRPPQSIRTILKDSFAIFKTTMSEASGKRIGPSQRLKG